jgi:hypothetical protein
MVNKVCRVKMVLTVVMVLMVETVLMVLMGAAGEDGKDASMFKDYMASIGYQPVQLQQVIAPPKKDYFRELDGLIGRSLFGKMIG